MGAVPETGADTAIGAGELNLNHGVAAAVLCRCPALAGTSLRAGHLLWFPIDLKLVRRIAFRFVGLTLLVAAGRPIEIHAVIPFALDQALGIYITRIHQVTVGEKTFVLQSFVDERDRIAISGGGGGRL